MSIQERQNRPESLALLAAQRLLYRRAKKMRAIGVVLVALIAVLGLSAASLDGHRHLSLPTYRRSSLLVI